MMRPTRNCACAPQIKALLDGELGPLERARTRFHLRRCPACQKEFFTMQNLAQELQSLETNAPIWPELKAKILAQLPTEPAQKSAPQSQKSAPKIRPVWVLAPALGVVLLLGAATLMGGRVNSTFGVAANSINTDAAPPAAPSLAAGASRGEVEIIRSRGGFGENSSFASPQTERKIHKNGSLALAVGNVESATTAIENIVTNSGGFVAQTSISSQGARRLANLELRIPTANFDKAQVKIGALGKITAKNSSSQDITARHAGAKAQRDALDRELAIAQAKLDALLKTKKPENRWQIQNQVASLRAQTARARAEFNSLNRLATLSNLSVSLEEKPAPLAPATFGQELGSTSREAFASFTQAAKWPLQLLIYALAYSPFWVPALLAWRKWGRKIAA